MKRKILFGILGGLIGLAIGIILGGYIGMVIGGTFLGGFDIYKNIGLEGYELSAYVGSIIGAVTLTIVGVKVALKIDNKKIKNG